MKKEINIYNLISSLFILIIGIVLVAKPSIFVDVVSLVIGSLLILAGIIKSILSLKNNELDSHSMYLGIIIIILGILVISFPGVIKLLIKIIFGSWILIAGIQRLIMALAIKGVDDKGSNTFLVSSLLMIVIGIFVLINFYNLIGIFLIIYAVMEIINYIYYSVRNKDYSKVFKKEVVKPKKNKRISKAIKEKKAIEAEIEE